MTGHKGLIGTSLLERLEREGHKPVLLVDKREGKNVLDINSFELNESADVLFHLASFNKINKCVIEPDIPFKEIAQSIHEVMKFCKEKKIPKIIYFSSSRVLKEERNVYTAAKLYGEELVKGYFQCYGIDYLIIRPSTVYGPRDTYTRRLVEIFLRKASKGEDLCIYGDGNKSLDFTYVEDFVDGLMLVLKEKNKAFDIGSGKEIRVSDVADLMINYFGKGRKVFLEPEIAQPQRVKIDISALEELGYSPKYDIEDGLKETIKWYLDNFDEIEEN